MSAKKYYKYEQRHRLVDGVREKKCTKCKKWKAQSRFSKNRRNKDGSTYWCKKCEAEYSRERYRKNRKSLKEYYTYEQRHRLADGVKQKRCSKCKKWRAESEFYKRRRHKDGLAMWCKECADKATNECRRRRLAGKH